AICASCTSSTHFATPAFGGWIYSCAILMTTSSGGWALRSLPSSCLSRHLCILHIIYQFRHPGIWGVDLLLCQSDGYQPCGLGLAVAPGVLPPATFVHPAHHLPISPPGHLGCGLTLVPI